MAQQPEKTLEEHLDEGLALYDQGYSFQKIRDHYQAQSLPEEMIAYIMRLIDEFALEEGKIQAQVKKAQWVVVFGLIMMVLGGFIAWLFYSNEAIKGYYYFFAYGPILFGAYIAWSGWRKMDRLRKTSPEIDDSKLRLDHRLGSWRPRKLS